MDEETFWADASSLILGSTRLDLPIKYSLAKRWALGLDDRFQLDMYLKHIEAFNGFYEAEPLKVSPSDFISSFRKNFESIKEQGFRSDAAPIQLSSQGDPIDGAHRVAIAAALSLKVRCVERENDVDFGEEFFFRRGLSEPVANFAQISRLEIQPSLFRVFIVHPVAPPYVDQELAVLIDKFGGRIYSVRNHNFRFRQSVALKRITYGGEAHNHWLGSSSDGFAGAERHARGSSGQYSTRIFLIGGLSDSETQKTKQLLRTLVGVGNYSCHSSDEGDDTSQMARMVFNSNFPELLRIIPPKLGVDNLRRKIETFRTEVSEFDPHFSETLIIGSALVELVGGRVARDLDMVSLASGVESSNLVGDLHSPVDPFLPATSLELVHHEKWHYNIWGVKLSSIDFLIRYKLSRREFPKDYLDIIQLAAVRLRVSPLGGRFLTSFLSQLFTAPARVNRFLRRVRDHLYRSLKPQSR